MPNDESIADEINKRVTQQLGAMTVEIIRLQATVEFLSGELAKALQDKENSENRDLS